MKMGLRPIEKRRKWQAHSILRCFISFLKKIGAVEKRPRFFEKAISRFFFHTHMYNERVLF